MQKFTVYELIGYEVEALDPKDAEDKFMSIPAGNFPEVWREVQQDLTHPTHADQDTFNKAK
jgi:hypothetical protein